MTEKDFIFSSEKMLPESGSFSWNAPSNIALVKYWGKEKNQIPANPSISFTLDECKTTTNLAYQLLDTVSDKVSFDFFFEGKKKEHFKPKLETFFKRIEVYCPYLKNYHFIIKSSNSFPHSSGIASSASGMAALALNIMSLEKAIDTSISESYFNKKASFLARLGSGSACRSIEGNLVVWGTHEEIQESSDLYGIQYPDALHPVFKSFHDTILLVDKGQKQVSSSLGHDLMNGHPYASRRFKQAHEHLETLKEVFKTGDLEAFIEIVESEALTLHAMMMTSVPYFLLMKPNTLQIIQKIWEFRKKTDTPICFTLDAGANVHVLYPDIVSDQVMQFIRDELVEYCENGHYINDQIGNGAKNS